MGKDKDNTRHWDETATLESTWRAMEAMVTEGKAKAIGVSNFSAAQCKEIQKIAKIPVACNQVERHPYWNQSELIEDLKGENIQITSYSPLGNLGRPVGDPLHGVTPLEDPIIKELATKLKKTPAQIIIRWHLQSGVSCIPKSTTPSRIIENLSVFDFALSAEDMTAINNLGHKMIRFVSPDFLPGSGDEARIFHHHDKELHERRKKAGHHHHHHQQQ